MRYLKAFVFAIIACISSFLGYKYVTADPPGYCRAQDRYISDDEFIRTSEALLEWSIKEDVRRWNTDPKLYAFNIKNTERLIDSLKRNQPRSGYVKVVRDDTRKISRRLMGHQQIQIVLNANSGDKQMDYYYDVCGHLIETNTITPGNISTGNYIESINVRRK